MGNKPNLTKNEILPDPSEIDFEPMDVDVNVVNVTAIRRGKVRELMRMGYTVPKIKQVLEKGVEVNGKMFKVDVHPDTIRYDIEYLRQEMVSENDSNLLEKRVEILDKLGYLYESSIEQYIEAQGQTKNSFLNTALAIMGKIVEIEGVKSPEAFKLDNNSEGKMGLVAEELNKLGVDERAAIITTIDTILTKRKRGGSEESEVPDGTSRIRTPSGDDEGVPREPDVRPTSGQTEAVQQTTTD